MSDKPRTLEERIEEALRESYATGEIREEQLAAMDADSEGAAATRRKISDLRLVVALRMEALAKRARGT